MLSRWILAASLGVASLLAPGCVTPKAQKLSWDEAFGKRPQKPAAITPTDAERAAALEDVPALLRTELTTFTLRTGEVRSRTPAGSAMPTEQQAHWTRVLDGVDRFLRWPVEELELADVARAHAIVEVELERDAQHFGELPPSLAERALDRVARLSERLLEVRRTRATACVKDEEGPCVADVLRELGESAFVWPIEPVLVTSLFGARLHPIHREWRMHSGIDLQAAVGQPVLAAATGKVLRAGWNGAHGIQVELEHANGLTTRYSHLSEALVQVGSIVRRGETVGLAGRSGAATGVHLHFEVWRDGQPTDPLDALVDAEPPSMSSGTSPRTAPLPSPANEKGAVRSGRRPSAAAR